MLWGRSMLMKYDRITFNPYVMGGVVFGEMRIPVSLTVNLVADGMTINEILSEHPDLEAEDIQQALQYAADLAEEELISFKCCQSVGPP